MEKKILNLYPSEWLLIFLLMGFCVALYFLNLHRWDLRKPDEPRYARIAMEMVTGGDWILMHLDGKMYTDKPPLFFWMIAFSSFLWHGFTSFSVRFPSAVFGTLTVILTFLIGRILYSSGTGFLSALILATSIEFAYLSIRANIDATLTFFTTFALYFFLRWYRQREGEDGGKGHPESLSIFGLYIGMGLATLSKGPVGFLLPLLVSLAYLLIQKDWKALKKMRLIPGMLLCFAMILSWYIPAALRGGRPYLEETLFLHTVSYYSQGWDHVKPFYFYLGSFPLDSLPWVIFFPIAVAYGCSKKNQEKRREFLYLLTWFIVVFVFFSISKGKRNLYLLPLYPAASLIVGRLWTHFISKTLATSWSRVTSILCYGFMAVGLLAGLGILCLVLKKPTFQIPNGLGLAICLMIGVFTSFLFARFKRYVGLFLLLTFFVGGIFFYAQYALFPMANRFESIRPLFNEIKRDMGFGKFLEQKTSPTE